MESPHVVSYGDFGWGEGSVQGGVFSGDWKVPRTRRLESLRYVGWIYAMLLGGTHGISSLQPNTVAPHVGCYGEKGKEESLTGLILTLSY